MGNTKENPLVTSSVRSLRIVVSLMIADLWLPLNRKKVMSWIRSSSVIGQRGYEAPSNSILEVKRHRGWCANNASNIKKGLNSEPNPIGVLRWAEIAS
jgi:hypothetical protein